MENTLSDSEKARLDRLFQGAAPIFMGWPIALDDNRIVTTIDIAAGAQAIAAQPDVPRNLNYILTDANDSVTATITFLGQDAQGRPIEEVAQITLGVGKTWTGTKIFAKVLSIVVTALTGEAGGDAIIIGVGNVIGLPSDINAAAEVIHTYVGPVLVTPDAIATGESTSGIDANSATYDGAKVMWALVQPAAQV